MIGARQRGCEIGWEGKGWQKRRLAVFVLFRDVKKGLQSPGFQQRSRKNIESPLLHVFIGLAPGDAPVKWAQGAVETVQHISSIQCDA